MGGLPYISDHAPVLLQFDNNQQKTSYPFKLNSIWLGEGGFSAIVQEVWSSLEFVDESSAQRRLVWKLKKLKHRVTAWVKEQRRLKHLKLDKIEED
jgi:hypothetical protein